MDPRLPSGSKSKVRVGVSACHSTRCHARSVQPSHCGKAAPWGGELAPPGTQARSDLYVEVMHCRASYGAAARMHMR